MSDTKSLSRIVLVIDNDHETRVLFRNLLESKGHFVVSAASGADALSLLPKMSLPSLIILRSNLQIMTSEQFLSVLRSSPDTAQIPIVQIKGTNERVLPDICHFIPPKPSSTELSEVIEKCLPS